MVKYILVTGGVISGVGKGVIASSTGLLLKTNGLSVSAIKIDPYLNIDAGTLSPLDHGEVFVLDDGGEVDLDLGNYERFLDVTLKRVNNITTGKIYKDVIERERKGDYLGKTVQVVPHVTDRIQEWITEVSKEPVDGTSNEPDVCIIELGGTIGDIESAPFVEAIRQFQFAVGPTNFFLIHVSLVPVVGSVGEQKSKPTQASVRDLRSLGLSPDIIACRSTRPLDDDVRKKIAMFCQVSPNHVLTVHDAESLYHVPLMLADQGLVEYLTKKLELKLKSEAEDPLVDWRRLATRETQLTREVNIALVGKYTYLQDSYISVVKALQHAASNFGIKLVMSWIEASLLEEDNKTEDEEKLKAAHETLRSVDGIIIPGGFGARATDGMIVACKYARLEKKPLLGICLGMQISVIEFARTELGMEGAHSTELDPDTKHPVVIYMPEVSKTHMGGTMRLGSRATKFVRECASKKLYGGKDLIYERHRHRYEINPEYIELFEQKGFLFVGRDENNERMEIVEIPDHPYFVGTQFHPEYKSRPLKPSPVFVGLLKAAAGLV